MYMSAFGLALALAASATAQYTTTGTQQTQTYVTTKATAEQVEQTLSGWMSQPREVARTMIAKYGLPHTASGNMMVWHNNGPWKMTVLENVMIPHNFPMPHHDMLYQCIDYPVPESLFDDLAHFDGSVIVERTRGTLGARCDNEEANFLAINLAKDIIMNDRSVSGAREFYADAIEAKMSARTDSTQARYLNGFTFDVYSSDYGDRDRVWDGTEEIYVESPIRQYRQDKKEMDEESMWYWTMWSEGNRFKNARMNGLPGRPNWGALSQW
jgi:hypothetical protein